jgi:SAM-dependent methyltransferase
VLDVGCGFGDSTRQIARLVGAAGEAVGVDVAERFIEVARQEAEEEGVPNASFVTADVQATQPDGPFDYAFSRFGTMFFASPGAAMRRVREALVPGGRLCMVVWRRKLDNEWLHRAELAINDLLERPQETDEPTCGPGPFSMADADTTSEILIGAGFEAIELRREDLIFELGPDLEKARELVMALGPAGELIRLAGDEADQIRGKLESAVDGALAECVQPDGSGSCLVLDLDRHRKRTRRGLGSACRSGLAGGRRAGRQVAADREDGGDRAEDRDHRCGEGRNPWPRLSHVAAEHEGEGDVLEEVDARGQRSTPGKQRRGSL